MSSNGQIRVSIPAWAPYSAGIIFANTKLDWIKEHKTEKLTLANGQAIGKAHHIVFVTNSGVNKITSRVKDTEIIVKFPMQAHPSSAGVQDAARKASIKALRQQAEALLPQRLNTLSIQYNFDYKSVTVRQLKGRWGSCDQDKNITLNLFLMQLPWKYIDYVILHELTHTKILQHGAKFWIEMESVFSGARVMSKQLKEYQPVLVSPQKSTMA